MAAVAAQVDRQAGSLPHPPIGTIFRRDSSGGVFGQVAGGAGAVQQRIPGIVSPAVPGLAPLMAPDDPMTQRCAAELAPLLGSRPLNLVGAASVGPTVPYVPPAISATSPSPTPSEQGRRVIATVPSTAPTAPAGPLSSPGIATFCCGGHWICHIGSLLDDLCGRCSLWARKNGPHYVG